MDSYDSFCHSCGMYLGFEDGSRLEVHGAVASEVRETAERLLPYLRPASRDKVPADRQNDSVWISGSFYLLVGVVAVVVALAIVKLAPGWLIVPTVGIAILLFVTIGAFVLRHSGKLSEKGLLGLINEVCKRVWGLGVLLKRPT